MNGDTGPEESWAVHWMWLKVVDDYSRRGLTYVTDTFPAISGLVSLFAKALKGRYLAGLWLGSHLSFSLLWRAVEPVKPSAEYLAPSWSWASIQSPVENYKEEDTYGERCDGEVYIEVLGDSDADCSKGAFGEIRNKEKPYLRLRGRLQQGELCFTKHEDAELKPWVSAGFVNGESYDSVDVDFPLSDDLPIRHAWSLLVAWIDDSVGCLFLEELGTKVCDTRTFRRIGVSTYVVNSDLSPWGELEDIVLI